MELFGLTIQRTKNLPQLQPVSSRGGWWRVVSEPSLGAWQRNEEISTDTVLSNAAVYACVTLIASDIAKLGVRLVAEDAHGIWRPTESPAFSPVLKRPNRWQNKIKFIEQWIMSKLTTGNTFVLKERDRRGVVTALYVLDPSRVTPLVATDGSVFFQLKRDDLSGLPNEMVTVPASEIILDVHCPLYHPLCGVSPIYACGLAAMQAIRIQTASSKFFANGSNPGGVLTAPGAISDETALRLKEYWNTNFSGDNIGRVAVLGDGLKYDAMSVSATDAQLIDQLNWTGTTVCSAFHIQPYMISIGPPPPYANIEPLTIQYYTQALQSLIENLELCLDEGLELPKPYGTEVDLSNLFRMDTATKVKAASDAIVGGGMSPNEARFRYLDLGPVEGGDTPYLQAQNRPLRELSRPEVVEPVVTPPVAPPVNEDDQAAAFAGLLHRKLQEAGLCA